MDDSTLHCNNDLNTDIFQHSSLLVPLQILGSEAKVVFCPSFRKTAEYYLDIAQKLSPDMPVYSFIWPESNADIYPSDTLEVITQDFLKDLKSCIPFGPYIVGGFCFGAVIAIELAKILSKSEELVEFLVLIDPILPSTDPYWKQWIKRRIKNFKFYMKQGIRYYINVQIRSYKSWIEYLQANPKEKTERKFHRAHRRAFYHYRADISLHKALLVFSHAEHPEENSERCKFETNRWKDIFPYGFEFLILAECTHQNILSKGTDIISSKIRDTYMKENKRS